MVNLFENSCLFAHLADVKSYLHLFQVVFLLIKSNIPLTFISVLISTN